MPDNRDQKDTPPENPADSKGLSDLGPAQPTNPPHRDGEHVEERNAPSPAGIPKVDEDRDE